MNPPARLFLAGPTASGKSAVALLLAERLGGEIISVDSMAVYRGMDIGTAKPSPEERDRVPHHLIDVAEVSETFDAARFAQLAAEAEKDIRSRGRTAIYSGGTGLYFRACLEGLGSGPTPDPELRARLEAAPLPDLLAELARTDPATFERIDRNNPRRVVRAVEVIRQTGRPYSEQRAEWKVGQQSGAPFFGIHRESGDLRQRIEARVDEMFTRGLVEETRRLLAQGLTRNPTALQALGYRQVLEHLRGEHDLAATVQLVKTKTWQFARRQMTWFRHQAAVDWIDVAADDAAGQIAESILARLSSAS